MSGDHDFIGSQFALFSASPATAIVLGYLGTDTRKLRGWCHRGLG